MITNNIIVKDINIDDIHFQQNGAIAHTSHATLEKESDLKPMNTFC